MLPRAGERAGRKGDATRRPPPGLPPRRGPVCRLVRPIASPPMALSAAQRVGRGGRRSETCPVVVSREGSDTMAIVRFGSGARKARMARREDENRELEGPGDDRVGVGRRPQIERPVGCDRVGRRAATHTRGSHQLRRSLLSTKMVSPRAGVTQLAECLLPKSERLSAVGSRVAARALVKLRGNSLPR